MVKANSVGEVLTSDEVLERLEQADAEKARKKSSKKGKKDQRKDAECVPDKVYCGSCGQVYTEEEAPSWVGCDSWWHFWCAGFSSMPSEEEDWACEYCQ